MEEIEASTANDIVESMGMNEEPDAIFSGLLIIEVAIAFVGLLGNLLVCFVISQQRKFRSGLKLFIRNLALADIGILTITFPITVVKEKMPLHWPFGRAFCLYGLPVAEVFHGVSIWSITAIAIERYRKIASHTGVQSNASDSSKALKWGLFLIWMVSYLVISFPLHFFMVFKEEDTMVLCATGWTALQHGSYTICSSIFWFVLPLGIIVFTYVQISRQLQQSNRFHRSSISQRSRGDRKLETSTIRSSQERKRMHQNSKAMKILTPIVLVFAVSMLPINAVRVLVVFWDEVVFEKYFGVFFDVCVIGVLVNAASDPFIYSIVAKDFRVELKMIWFRFYQRLRNLVDIKATDGYSGLNKFIGFCYRKPREGPSSDVQEKSVLETPQTLLSTPV